MHGTIEQPITSFNTREKAALEECERLISHFQKKSKSSKSRFQFYKYASIILAAMVTVASTLELFYGPVIPKVIIPVLGALTTLAATFLSVSKSQKIWASSRTTSQRLTKEKFLYLQRASVYENRDDEKRLALFSKNIMDLWSEGHEKWETAINET